MAVLPGVYKRIESVESRRAARRLSNLQDRLGNRLSIIPRAKGWVPLKDDISNYSQEKTRDDIFFTKSSANKVAIVEHAHRAALDLAHEVRSPENRKRHAITGLSFTPIPQVTRRMCCAMLTNTLRTTPYTPGYRVGRKRQGGVEAIPGVEGHQA